MKNKSERVTRGTGLLENVLSRKRSRKANKLIPDALRSGRLLDIGCGTYPHFLVETEFKEKYGVDQSPEITRHCELVDAHQSLHLVQWDFAREEKLPFEDEFFDVITMLAVFEHIEPARIRRLVAEILRTLKTGGLFIMTTPAGWTDWLLRLLACLKLVSAVEIEDHKDTYSHKKITRILEDCEFRREKITLGYFELFMNIWGKAQK
ncbi:MAG: methyltransferase domain-containing protein [Candidatus Aminicenantes bacterium]|nr:methyltransferase domain-containing protein [Candidatus Aminicenantes bacterium]NIM80797.1 methyltransferase domain-containing protein [Candidatus Aminicenantes bacterium]NIN20180.1 methyltransferase domain-containing protein [Candidatus Aminicenantes bacterium]NIN43959.1 methyltransferase domain-containing protein [Candidatus Aminicenantes bacterium]NIN86768.1 methyltransferase domain-containing protein [Candidatus Aminicenantes bacterium]